MNFNFRVECSACGSSHRVRIQAGYLSEYPVRFYCGGCGSPIRGFVHHYPEAGNVLFVLESGAPATVHEFDPTGSAASSLHLVECSGELLTRKMELQSLSSLDVLVGSNPFFEAVSIMGFDTLSSYTEQIVRALDYYSNRWPSRESALRLVMSGRKAQAEALLGESLGEAPTLELVHNLLGGSLPVLIDEGTLNRAGEARLTVRKLDAERLSEMASFYSDHNIGMPTMVESCIGLFSDFARRFSYLIPGFTYLASEKGYDLSRFGSYLCYMDDLRALYSDCVESLGDFMRILIGMDNIFKRGNYDQMAEGAPARTFEKLLTGAPKGKILEQAGSDTYTSLVGDRCWNVDLRNAFDHNSFKVNHTDQLIQVIRNDGSFDDSLSMYVVEMASRCVDMLRTLYVMEAVTVEINSRTQRS